MTLPKVHEKEMRVNFKIGEMAVYPAHGVGIVQAIE
ncbi:MAG: hypothetical protein H6Q84_1099, partial [Deltaproteobacteria bacterium]|nr:hypothetical protein [Deltaproteobacteria bacterium]